MSFVRPVETEKCDCKIVERTGNRREIPDDPTTVVGPDKFETQGISGPLGFGAVVEEG